MLRQILALVFLYAGVSKLRSPASSRATLRQAGRAVPGLDVVGVGHLAAIEIALGAWLLGGLAAGGAAAAAAVLLLAFIVVLGRMRATGQREIDCHCFGAAADGSTVAGVITRNAGLLALAVLAGLGIGEPRGTGAEALSLLSAVGTGLAVLAARGVRTSARRLSEIREHARRPSTAGAGAGD